MKFLTVPVRYSGATWSITRLDECFPTPRNSQHSRRLQRLSHSPQLLITIILSSCLVSDLIVREALVAKRRAERTGSSSFLDDFLLQQSAQKRTASVDTRFLQNVMRSTFSSSSGSVGREEPLERESRSRSSRDSRYERDRSRKHRGDRSSSSSRSPPRRRRREAYSSSSASSRSSSRSPSPKRQKIERTDTVELNQDDFGPAAPAQQRSSAEEHFTADAAEGTLFFRFSRFRPISALLIESILLFSQMNDCVSCWRNAKNEVVAPLAVKFCRVSLLWTISRLPPLRETRNERKIRKNHPRRSGTKTKRSENGGTKRKNIDVAARMIRSPHRAIEQHADSMKVISFQGMLFFFCLGPPQLLEPFKSLTVIWLL